MATSMTAWQKFFFEVLHFLEQLRWKKSSTLTETFVYSLFQCMYECVIPQQVGHS